jgi:hypothetical protein
MVPQHSHPTVVTTARSRSARALLCALCVLSACDSRAPAIAGRAASPDESELGALHDVIARSARLADSVEALLEPVPLLTPGEESGLRRASNAQQLARARALGLRITDEAALRAALDAGTLVTLEDSTDLWVVRALDHSQPYVTPDARALLARIGERFQERLGEMGLPRYRLEVSSVLRSPASQAELRAGNVNAAAGTSTHEYGTTLDVAYSGYAAPADGGEFEGLASAPARAIAHRASVALLEAAAARKSRELQKILGDVLRELQAAGDVLVTLERQQPVYHFTVARRFTTGD